ncbi:MAG TPA: glutamate racemase [Longimicrobiales bacterium]|nr:glutamate racemase [Longimicrobiales bacterium]
MSSGDNRPIGIFDSGIGGLTVAQAIFQLLPNESVCYFGDTARVPYGPKSPTTVLRYSREAAAFLMSKDVKMLVIACNTATAHAAEALAQELPIPVVGVVEPGARTAARTTRSGRVGVIGTAGTIASGAYDLAVRRLVEDARVYAQPCPLFVPLIEEGWQEHEATRLVAREYLEPLHEVDIDVLILGCTHYPLLAAVIQETLGPDVKLVDSAHETAIEVRHELQQRQQLRAAAEQPTHAFFASDSPMRFKEVGSRFLGGAVLQVEKVVVEGREINSGT